LRTAALLDQTVPGIKIESSEPYLRQVRGRKTAEELRRLKLAIDGSIDLYHQLVPQLTSGMSEREIQSLMVDIAAELGFAAHLGDYGGPLVCINRIGLAHRSPGDDRVQPGDLLILDHGLAHEGYYSDIARTIYVRREGEAEAPAAERAAFASAKRAIEAAFAAMRPGVKGHEVDAVARQVHLVTGFPEI